MKRTRQQIIGIAAGSLFGALSLAANANAMTFVNTELVLSIDTSGSTNDVVPNAGGKTEYQLQIEGYINAFNSVGIRDQIKSLSKGIAVGVNTWGGSLKNSAMGNFFHLTDDASITTFIDNALNPLLGGSGSGGTNIAAGINDAVGALLDNEFMGDRLVVDVSGDGKQNVGTGCTGSLVNSLACTSLVTTARAKAFENDITINGLPILTDFDDLDAYYKSYVVNGAEAFTEPANGFADFAHAAETKIGREIEPVPEPASLLGLGLVGLAGAGAALKRKHSDA